MPNYWLYFTISHGLSFSQTIFTDISNISDKISSVKISFLLPFARAFMNEPDLLILDEPCSGLDVKSREYLLSVLEKNSKNENAVPFIYVTH